MGLFVEVKELTTFDYYACYSVTTDKNSVNISRKHLNRIDVTYATYRRGQNVNFYFITEADRKAFKKWYDTMVFTDMDSAGRLTK